MKPIGFDHMNLTVNNFEETANWYHRVFGFEVVESGDTDEGKWGVLRSGDSMLCIYEEPERTKPSTRSSDPSESHRIYHFGLRIADRLEWEKTLKTEKLKTYFWSPVQYPHSTSWYVKDPTGYTIEVALWDNNEVRF